MEFLGLSRADVRFDVDFGQSDVPTDFPAELDLDIGGGAMPTSGCQDGHKSLRTRPIFRRSEI